MVLINCHRYMISVINRNRLQVDMVNISIPMRIITIILTMAMWKESDTIDTYI